jgi:TolA-binding protein
VKAVKVRHASRVTPATPSGFRSLGLGAVEASAEASRPAWAPPPKAEAPAPRSSPLEVPRASAAEAFSAANQARLEGDRPLAMARYRELLASWPATPEAQQTHATLGRMLLDRGNPSAALEQLDAYLAGGDGTLREEVLSARALALMRLGRVDDEARAWQTLLDHYPGSIHATRARSRLEALSVAR